jgi:FlaG/FlaF family flagellin (archaellin)
MVAITVILAAVIAAFVLGLGDTNSSAPNVNFDFELNEDTDIDGDDPTAGSLTVQHQSGDTFDNETIDIVGPTAGADGGFGASTSAGDSLVIDLAGSGVSENAESGDEIELVFLSEDGGSSSTIGTFTIPPSYTNDDTN